ncbi:MAG: NADH-quinone oxidoreductase subunit B family protein [Chloroflexi bacterium]|nr:NADH-quinone oxidoreductase subunit B family protein [Chloroflexota bacterium]
MEPILTWARVNSIWAVHFNSGSCNGCDIEILSTLTPYYDVERLGIELRGSPRHADVLVVTGAVTRQARDRLLRIHAQMPDPAFVMAVGTCAIGGGVFQGCYNVVGSVSDLLPVDMAVPGCPPRPAAIIAGFAALMERIRKGEPA